MEGTSMRDASTYGEPPREAEACPRLYWNAPVPFHPGAETAGDPLPVYANEGRWVAMCPDCGGAQLASQADPRFMCITCANYTNKGCWRPLQWPDVRPEIEAVLTLRPVVNQNWVPGETVTDLVVENAVYGATATAEV